MVSCGHYLCILTVVAMTISISLADAPTTSTSSSSSSPKAGNVNTDREVSMYDPALHLFVDDHHIRNAFAMKRIFGRLEKHGEPILEDIPDRDACWASVMREGGKFRMWYSSVYRVSVQDLAAAGVWGRGEEFGFFQDRHVGAIPETQAAMISYAESDDGIHWVKPSLGLVEWRGSKDNNIVLDGAAAAKQFDGTLTNMDSVSVIRDEAAPPRERYKLICHWETFHIYDNYWETLHVRNDAISKIGRNEEYIQRMRAPRGKYLVTSPDGIHWNPIPVWIKACAGGGDYCGVTRDERNACYWFNDRAPVAVPGIPGIRTAGLCQSRDLYHWPENVEQVFAVGEFEDYGRRYEHHGMTPFNYGDQDLCFLEVSVGGRPVMSVLGSHRDGQRWQLPGGRTVLLEKGPQGSFDDTIVNPTRNAPFAVGEKLFVFYNGRHYADNRRSSRICLATMRLDGFAGMTVDPPVVERLGKPAVLQTHPLTVTQDQLQINLVGHGGTAKVALLGENARPLKGYGLDDCLPLPDDATRAVVRWKDHPDLRDLKGQRVMVMVQLASGTVYSVRL